MLPLRLALLVLLVPSLAWGAQPKKRPEDKVQAKQFWEQSCWPCHGRDAAGEGPLSAQLPVTVPDLRALPEEKREEQLNVIMNGKGWMPSYRSELTRREAQRILVYLQDLEEESAPGRPETAEPRRETTPGASRLPAPPEGAAGNTKPEENAP